MVKEERSPYVAIPASLGGILLIICVAFLVFAQDIMVHIIPTIAWAFVVLGVFSAFFALLATKKDKK